MLNKKEYDKQWVKDNPNKIKEYKKRYREKNSDKIKEYMGQWHLNNKEHEKQYEINNKDKRVKQKHQYYLENKEYIITRKDWSANTVTIQPLGSQLIYWESSEVLYQYETLVFSSDNTNYL